MNAPEQRSYAETVRAELDSLGNSYTGIVGASGIKNIDPNRGLEGTGIFIAASAHWGWTASDDELKAARMELLGRIEDLEPRFRLLFPHPIPAVTKRLKDLTGYGGG